MVTVSERPLNNSASIWAVVVEHAADDFGWRNYGWAAAVRQWQPRFPIGNPWGARPREARRKRMA